MSDNNPETIFERAKQLMADAQAAGMSLRINVPTASEVARFQTKPSVMVGYKVGDEHRTLYTPTEGPYWG